MAQKNQGGGTVLQQLVSLHASISRALHFLPLFISLSDEHDLLIVEGKKRRKIRGRKYSTLKVWREKEFGSNEDIRQIELNVNPNYVSAVPKARLK